MIALDSNVFVYLLEGHETYGECARDIFVHVEQTHAKACASELVFFELLAYKGLSDHDVQHITSALESLDVTYGTTTKGIAMLAAELRRVHGLGALDSLHVANAISMGAEHFITNDERLVRKKVPDIEIVALAESQDLF